MQRVILGLGSNTPYKGKSSPELLALACKKLRRLLSDCVFSSLYESRPMYVEDQAVFYNMCAIGYVADSCNPYELLAKIHKIEKKYGRNRRKEIRFGPRSLDIDIEEFGSVLSSDPILTLPHPRIQERAFVLIPALEILTESADEQIRNKYSSFLQALPDQSVQMCSQETQEFFLKILNSGRGAYGGTKK